MGPADQQAVVDGAVESVDRDPDIEIAAQLAASDPALEDGRRSGAAGGDVALAERFPKR